MPKKKPPVTQILASILSGDRDKPEPVPDDIPPELRAAWLAALLQEPRGLAWNRLEEVLRAAVHDPVICESQDVRDMTLMLYHLSAAASSYTTSDGLVAKLESALGKIRRLHAVSPRAAVKRRVQAEWTAHHGEYTGKADFARIQAAILANEGLAIKPNEIATRWLKGL